MCAIQTTKNRINRELSKLPVYQDGIDIDAIFSIVQKHGGSPVCEDGTPWSGFFCGETGTADIKINGIGMKGAWLRLSWYKFETTGRYEVLSYVN
jgi:hypothetical protein